MNTVGGVGFAMPDDGTVSCSSGIAGGEEFMPSQRLWAHRACLLVAGLAPIVSATDAYSCSRVTPVSSVEMVQQADAIMRVTAVEYARPPRDPSMHTAGLPDSTVRFKVLEVIRGRSTSKLVLPGYLVDRDDFNDQPPPYDFVRSNGRSGSCFANSYRRGGQFLLILKREQFTGYTANWYALGPTNEQLHSANDPWLAWVREQVKGQKAKNGK
jgi:hypothetical protein